MSTVKIRAKRPGPGFLVATLDTTAGELSGRHAAEVQGMVDDALAAGAVITDPYPTRYAMSDPLRDPAQMAVILHARGLQLRGQLAAVMFPRGELLEDELPGPEIADQVTF